MRSSASSNRKSFTVNGLVLLLLTGAAGAARCPTVRVRVIESPLGCVETVVTESRRPTGPSMADGGSMRFRDDIGQGIRELYVDPGSYPVANVGERVRICLLNVPKKTTGCDPAKDIRGREFLVYVHTNDADRVSNNAAVYTNAEHWCGGA